MGQSLRYATSEFQEIVKVSIRKKLYQHLFERRSVVKRAIVECLKHFLIDESSKYNVTKVVLTIISIATKNLGISLEEDNENVD